MAAISKLLDPAALVKALENAKLAKLKGLSNGLKKAGLFLQRESQKLVPVDFGNLKASAFTRAQGSKTSPEVIVGYTAAYAPFVHENVAMKLKGQARPKPHLGVYWGPAGQAKFLEQPARDNLKQITQIVQDEIKGTNP